MIQIPYYVNITSKILNRRCWNNLWNSYLKYMFFTRAIWIETQQNRKTCCDDRKNHRYGYLDS